MVFWEKENSDLHDSSDYQNYDLLTTSLSKRYHPHLSYAAVLKNNKYYTLYAKFWNGMVITHISQDVLLTTFSTLGFVETLWNFIQLSLTHLQKF